MRRAPSATSAPAAAVSSAHSPLHTAHCLSSRRPPLRFQFLPRPSFPRPGILLFCRRSSSSIAPLPQPSNSDRSFNRSAANLRSSGRDALILPAHRALVGHTSKFPRHSPGRPSTRRPPCTHSAGTHQAWARRSSPPPQRPFVSTSQPRHRQPRQQPRQGRTHLIAGRLSWAQRYSMRCGSSSEPSLGEIGNASEPLGASFQAPAGCKEDSCNPRKARVRVSPPQGCRPVARCVTQSKLRRSLVLCHRKPFSAGREYRNAIAHSLALDGKICPAPHFRPPFLAGFLAAGFVGFLLALFFAGAAGLSAFGATSARTFFASTPNIFASASNPKAFALTAYS